MTSRSLQSYVCSLSFRVVNPAHCTFNPSNLVVSNTSLFRAKKKLCLVASLSPTMDCSSDQRGSTIPCCGCLFAVVEAVVTGRVPEEAHHRPPAALLSDFLQLHRVSCIQCHALTRAMDTGDCRPHPPACKRSSSSKSSMMLFSRRWTVVHETSLYSRSLVWPHSKLNHVYMSAQSVDFNTTASVDPASLQDAILIAALETRSVKYVQRESFHWILHRKLSV